MLNTFSEGVKSSLSVQRLLLAAKTALAVGIAWFLAPLVPGVADDYPYYAPLGALVSMYPTMMGSVRAGVQTLAGLLMGIVLATGVLLAGDPNVITISLAVGVGVVVSGQHWLGAGREYVPVATLFVLIIGGQHADEYSIGYAVQMTLGILVGLVVNATVLPPLSFDSALLRLSRCRHLLARQLGEIAHALVEEWPPKYEDWAGRSAALDAMAGEVRTEVFGAHESQKANPRAGRRRYRELSRTYFEDLGVLETITFHVRDLSEVLASAVWHDTLNVELAADLCAPISQALDGVADALRAWDDGADLQHALGTAEQRWESLIAGLGQQSASATSMTSPAMAVAMDVQRILAALRSRAPVGLPSQGPDQQAGRPKRWTDPQQPPTETGH